MTRSVGPVRPRRLRLYLGFGFLGLAIGVGCGPRAELIDLGPMAIVRGIILDKAMNPTPNAKVGLEGPEPYSTFTRSDGTFQIDGVLPELYDLFAEKVIGDVTCRVRLRHIRLVNDQVFIAPDLVLANPGVISGQVLISGAASFAGVNVLILGTRFGSQIPISTDAQGNFTIPDIEEGTYDIAFSRSDLINTAVTNVIVAGGATVTVGPVTMNLVDPPRIGAICGRIELESRVDHSGVLVRIDGTPRNTITTSGGNFVFENLPISTYSLSFARQDFFDRRIVQARIATGSAKLDLGAIAMDAHRTLNTSIEAFELEWAPNGSQIAYITSASSDTAEIALTDPTTQVFNVVITSQSRAVASGGIAWSPDGDDLVFTRALSGNENTSSLGIVSKEGSALRDLLPLGNKYAMPAFAPDGNKLAYFLDPEVRTVEISRSTGSTRATSSTSRVIDSIGTITRMTGMEWSNTGRIVYSPTPMTTSEGLFSVFTTGGGRLEIVPTVTPGGVQFMTAQSPTLRPRDFSRVAFSFQDSTDDPTTNGIYICDLDGQNATRITTVPGNNLEWSPDGTRILFTRLPSAVTLPSRISEVLVPVALQ